MVSWHTKLALGVTCLVLAFAAAADYKRDYGDALRALEKGDLEKAIEELESAIAENAQSAERIRLYGVRYEPYLPHYYLGLARVQSGDCEGAMRAWSESSNQGVIAKTDLAPAMQQQMQRCQASVVDIDAVAGATRTQVGVLNGAIATAEDIKANPQMRDEWSKRPEWDRQLQQAKNLSRQISTGLDGAISQRDEDQLTQWSDQAAQLSGILSSEMNTASEWLAEAKRRQQQQAVAARRNEARQELLRLQAAARSPANADLTTPTLNRLRNELDQLAQRAATVADGQQVDAMTQLARELNGKLRSYRQAVQEYQAEQAQIARRQAPEALKTLAQNFFSGKYREVTAAANPADFSSERERIQAHLFRAAAAYHQYVLSGSEDARLLRVAQNDIRAIKQIDGGFSPYLAAFSPRFVTLFDQTM